MKLLLSFLLIEKHIIDFLVTVNRSIKYLKMHNIQETHSLLLGKKNTENPENDPQTFVNILPKNFAYRRLSFLHFVYINTKILIINARKGRNTLW